MTGHLKMDFSENDVSLVADDRPLVADDRPLGDVVEMQTRQQVPLDHNLEHKKPYFGLPEEVVFCSQCVVSNQRPNSAVEYKHRKDTPKKPSNLIGLVHVMPAVLLNAKSTRIGQIVKRS